MFWKIIFVIYSILLFIIGIYCSLDSDTSNLINISNQESIEIILTFVIMYLLFNILYGLARKIQTLPVNWIKILLMLTVCGNICLALSPDNYRGFEDLSRVLRYFALPEIFILLYALPLLLFYIPLIAYHNQYQTFNKKLKKQSFNLITLFLCIIYFVPNICYAIYYLFTHKLEDNIFISLLVLIGSLYLTLCAIGIVFRKMFMPRKLLKLTCIPVILIVVTGCSMTEFKKSILELVQYPIIINLFIFFILIFYCLILYRYAFTDYVDETPDYIKLEPVDNKSKTLWDKIKKDFKEKKKVSKLWYLVLIFFFGGLGIHKFYAKKFCLGILYLLLFWTSIPSFVSFIEFITAIFNTSDENGDIEVW